MTKLKYEVTQDEYTESPREWDNIGTMICSHRSYILGDEQFDSGDYDGWNDLESTLRKENDIAVILPLYLYDHSGISMYTTGDTAYRQHEAWDAGQVGFIYATTEDLKREYGDAEDGIERLTEYLKGEVETYSKYLQGDVYQVTAYDADGEEVDSCGGIYGQEGVDDFIKDTEDGYTAPRDSSKAKNAQELHV